MTLALQTAPVSVPHVVVLQKQNAPIICNAALSPQDLKSQINHELLQHDLVEVVLMADPLSMDSHDPQQNPLLPQLDIIKDDIDNIVLSCDPVTANRETKGSCTVLDAAKTASTVALHCHNKGILLQNLKLNVSATPDDTHPADIPAMTELKNELTQSEARKLNNSLKNSVAGFNAF